MNSRFSRHGNLILASVTAIALLALTSCTGPQITSPVGEWVAIDGDEGTLSIHPDGTFTMIDASFNPLQGRDADSDFNARGRWLTARDDTEIAFDFEEASQGPRDVEPRIYFVPYRSGTLRFQDAEGLFEIEFRLVDEPSK
ncbi:hypothetical protein [Microbacterium sp. LCT-H2]|uniref:hypothetical protein n=1 Tax=Microbacterium sp. LCT-H2 TaxID=1914306 RepID=UPI0008F4D95E|nr:hypothetical protein [Microbacterium sp. LCT-H2]OIJ32077.1 hypothetical protein BK819_12730 [Microbacterium sp. LCT-H2]